MGCKHCFPASPMYCLFLATMAQILFLLWFILHIVEVGVAGTHTIAWLSFTFMACIITFARLSMRAKYNIWGNPLEDFFMSLSVYPFVLAQMEMQTDTEGKDAKTYFETA